ncbi:MAG TPA: hypothetical protein VFO19_22485 [Vicinamibacterales bacterium]|nr:hypothetical protein [Vicinamibacterales bacterium]
MDAGRPLLSEHPISTCHEVVFQRAVARIEIFDRPDAAGLSGFAAQIWLLDDDGAVRRLLVDRTSKPIEIHGRSASTALSAAITFLEGHYGALNQYAHECRDFGAPPTIGEVVMIE